MARNVILYLALTVLPAVFVDCKKECEASITSPGPQCTYESNVYGAHNMHLKYTVHSATSKICCDALQCVTQHCDFHDIGCGHGTWVSEALPWEAEHKPAIRCHAKHAVSSYSYTAASFV